MQALILDRGLTDHALSFLKNGETVVRRQFRFLCNAGVEHIIIVCHNDITDALRKETQASYLSNCRFSFVVSDNDSCFSAAKAYLQEEDTFILYNHLLFDATLLPAMKESGYDSCVIVDRTTQNPEAPFQARLGMKDILKVGTEFTGLGCYPMTPVFYLNADSMRFLLTTIATGATDWDALNCALPQMHLRPFSADSFFIAALSQDFDANKQAVCDLQYSDFSHQRTITTRSGILQISPLMRELGMHAPLLIHDATFSESTAKKVFTKLQITPVFFQVDTPITQQQAAAAAEVFCEQQLDSIISVGTNEVINAAKCVKLFICGTPADNDACPTVFSPIPHIAVPTSISSDTAVNTSVAVRSEAQTQSFTCDCLLPDAVIVDANLIAPASTEEKVAVCFDGVALCMRCLWSKFSTHKSRNLASRALELINNHKKHYLQDSLSATQRIATAMTLVNRAAFLDCLNRMSLEGEPLFRDILLPDVTNTPVSSETVQFEKEEGDIVVSPEQMAISSANKYLSHIATTTLKAMGGPAKTPPKKKKTSKKQRLLKRIKKLLQNAVPALNKRLVNLRKYLRFKWYGFKHGLDTQMVLFESAHGKTYNCNPRGIYQAMLNDPEYLGFTFVWALKNPKEFPELKNNPRTILVEQGSNAYIRRCAQAKYWVSNYNMPSYLKKGKDHVWIHTWHGKPIKRIGCDFHNSIRKNYDSRVIKRNYTNAAKEMTYLLSSAPAFSKHMANAYNLPALKKEHIVVETGYPRNDPLFTFTHEDVLRLKLNIGIPLDKKVVLYTPTWRVSNSTDAAHGFVYQSHLDLGSFSAALGEEYVILFRAHPYEAKSVDFSALGSNVLNMCNYPEVNDLYIISDLMISDYSGTIFDYANLRRPMVYYMYDRDEYVNEQTGVYFDLDTLPGPIVYKEEDLAQTVKETLENFVYDEKYQLFNQTYNLLDGPNCGRDTAHMLIPKSAAKSMSKQRTDKLREGLQNLRVRFTGFFRGLGLSRNPNTRAFAAYKNKFRGQRCFMVGNGPSLSLDDLNSIKNEYSFCCNLIYKIFDLTEWRPSFYCITDLVFTKTIAHELAENIKVPFFTTARSYQALKEKPEKSLFVNSVKKDDYSVHGNMKQYYIPANATVMTFMIELAMYMGFKEIYLIGVDCSNGFIGKDSHFIEDYENDDMMRIEYKRAGRALGNKHLTLEEFGKYRTDRAMFAYAKLRKYADKHGINIYNATRGGYLEEFERVNLDDLEFNAE